jgi:hypothetical protein
MSIENEIIAKEKVALIEFFWSRRKFIGNNGLELIG